MVNIISAALLVLVVVSGMFMPIVWLQAISIAVGVFYLLLVIVSHGYFLMGIPIVLAFFIALWIVPLCSYLDQWRIAL